MATHMIARGETYFFHEEDDCTSCGSVTNLTGKDLFLFRLASGDARDAASKDVGEIHPELPAILKGAKIGWECKCGHVCEVQCAELIAPHIAKLLPIQEEWRKRVKLEAIERECEEAEKQAKMPAWRKFFLGRA